MNAFANASPLDADPAAATKAAAAVQYGIGLIGVMKGFARCVFGLGRVTKTVDAGLRSEGLDTTSPKCRVNIAGVIGLLWSALHMADALRARLRNPAVAMAMMRPPSAPRGRGHAGQPRPQDPDDPMFLIGWRRTSTDSRSAFRDEIAHMSDRQVVERICTDLMTAAEILGDTEEAADVAIMAYRAAVLIFPDADKPAPDQAPSGPPARQRPARTATADGDAREPEMAGTQPTPREVGRGPP